jgi:hypothetical protein
MNEMQIDVQQFGIAGSIVDHVTVPHFLRQGLWARD